MQSKGSNSVALWILAVVALLFFLRASSTLLIPIILAALISFVLEPIVAWLARHHIPRVVGTSLLMLSLLVLCAWGVYTLRDDVRESVEALPRAAEQVRRWVTLEGETGPAARVREAAAILQGDQEASGAQSSGAGGSPQTSGSAVSSGHVEEQPADSAQQGGLGTVSLTGLLQQGVGSMLALAGHVTVIVFLVFFLLIAGHHFRGRIVEIAGPDPERRTRAIRVIDEINAQIQRFLLVRLVTAIVVGLLTWAVLAWMQVPQAAVWGLLSGVFNSIPYFGPVIVSGGLFVIGLVQSGGFMQALQMSGAALAITALEGWLITPPLLGKAERMSAIAVFLGLLLWTWLWGAWGTILAVPMLVVLKAVGDHLPPLRPVGRLLAP